MNKCRLCLKSRKKMLSMFSTEDGTTLVNMVTSIANVKIHNGDGFTDKICSLCTKKLREAYEFKICIERSSSILHKNDHLKRISFNNLEDIKIKVEIDTDFKPALPSIELFPNKLFKDGAECVCYKDTSIKKLKLDADDKKTSEALSVMEFLKTIKTEHDSDIEYDYQDDVSNDGDYRPNSLTRTNKKQTHKKQTNKEEKYSKKKRDKFVRPARPIKPKFIEDIRIVPTKIKYENKKRFVRKKYSAMSICPYCGLQIKTIKMRRHMLLHTGEKSFKCETCVKSFYTLGELNHHRKLHIDGFKEVQRLKCEQCVAVFGNKTSLRSHMRTHQDVRNYICGVCNKAFKWKAGLNRHEKIHGGSATFECDVCSTSFNNKYGLKHHLRVHTGERPYKCEICSQPYSYKHDFNRHCFKKHGVFLKRRSVYVMNDVVLKREKELMRDLVLRVHGVIKEGEPINPFEGPQAALAFEQALRAIQNKQITIDFQI